MVNVEFFGPLRYYTNTRRAEATVNRDATIKDLNASLSKQFPELLHKVIDPENFELIVPYMCSVNAKLVSDVNARIFPGDNILFFFGESGG